MYKDLDEAKYMHLCDNTHRTTFSSFLEEASIRRYSLNTSRWKKPEIKTNPVDRTRRTPNNYSRTEEGTCFRTVMDWYPEEPAIFMQEPIALAREGQVHQPGICRVTSGRDACHSMLVVKV